MGISRSLAHKTICISSLKRSTRALTQAEPHLAVAPEQLRTCWVWVTADLHDPQYDAGGYAGGRRGGEDHRAGLIEDCD